MGRLFVRGHILLPREAWWRVAAAQPGEGKLWRALGCSSAHRAAMGTGPGAGSHCLVVPRGRDGEALLSPEPYRSQKTGRRQHRAAGAVTLHPRRRARVGGASSRTDTATPGVGCASVSGLWPLGPCLGSCCHGCSRAASSGKEMQGHLSLYGSWANWAWPVGCVGVEQTMMSQGCG